MSAADNNSAGRFSGQADAYARYRPPYPDEADPRRDCPVRPRRGRPRVVDVGCGTGICSRLFAERGISVIGVEPNSAMRRRAEATPCPAGPPPRYRTGTAEATGLPDAIADCVVAAQAFHWFDAGAALREFHRLLKPGGWMALLWYERDESDEFTETVGDLIRTAPDAAEIESHRLKAGDVLAAHPLFGDYDRRMIPTRLVAGRGRPERPGVHGFLRPERRSRPERRGRRNWTHSTSDSRLDGLVRLCYETTVHMAKRR